MCSISDVVLCGRISRRVRWNGEHFRHCADSVVQRFRLVDMWRRQRRGAREMQRSSGEKINACARTTICSKRGYNKRTRWNRTTQQPHWKTVEQKLPSSVGLWWNQTNLLNVQRNGGEVKTTRASYSNAAAAAKCCAEIFCIYLTIYYTILFIYNTIYMYQCKR